MVKALLGHVKYLSEPALLAWVLARLAALRAYAPVSVHWLPGHVGVAGNEAADALAGAGAKLSATRPWPSTYRDMLYDG